MGIILRIERSLCGKRPWESLSSNLSNEIPRHFLPISAKNRGILPGVLTHLIPSVAFFCGHSSHSLS